MFDFLKPHSWNQPEASPVQEPDQPDQLLQPDEPPVELPDPEAMSSEETLDADPAVSPEPDEYSEFEEEIETDVPDEDPLDDWKDQLRERFEEWLEGIAEIPEFESDDVPLDEPDLYSFYEQWAAFNAEYRKGNRRSAEAFSQWGDALTRFDADLARLREQLAEMNTAAEGQEVPDPFCLALIEILDRIARIQRAFEASPPPRWWGRDGLWRKSWETQRHALEILAGHFEALLKKAGLSRMEVVRAPFDPASMVALDTEPRDDLPHQTVVEEIAPGYLRNGQLLRVAQVKITLRNKL